MLYNIGDTLPLAYKFLKKYYVVMYICTYAEEGEHAHMHAAHLKNILCELIYRLQYEISTDEVK